MDSDHSVRHDDTGQPGNDEGNGDLVTIRQFGDQGEALFAKGCLESAGIECFLADANITRMEWPLSRGMRLQVMAKDAAAATELLQQAVADAAGD
jgi:hypothetical protein